MKSEKQVGLVRRLPFGSRAARKRLGFTIIETIMVLGISTMMFVLVATTLRGRQYRTEFAQSIQDIKSQMQQAISEVGSGYYPNTGRVRCVPSATGPTLTDAVSTQGGNDGCIFIGKVIHFSGPTTTTKNQFNIYSMAGLQRVSTAVGAKEVTTYLESKPAVIAPTAAIPSRPSVTQTGKLLYGLTAQRMQYQENYTYQQPEDHVRYDNPGLRVTFWPNSSYFSGPVCNTVGQNIDFWAPNGNPIGFCGIRSSQEFSDRWTGYFMAHGGTGCYQFGALNDDEMWAYINGLNVLASRYNDPWSNSTPNWGPCVNLQSGTGVPIVVDHFNRPAHQAMARLFVRSPNGNSQVVPPGWLRQDRTTWTTYNNVDVTGRTRDISAIAFANSLATYGVSSLLSGSQNVNMIPMFGTTLIASATATVGTINDNFNDLGPYSDTNPPLEINPLSGVKLCFVSDSSNQSGIITIGSNGRQLTVALKIMETKTCPANLFL